MAYRPTLYTEKQDISMKLIRIDNDYYDFPQDKFIEYELEDFARMKKLGEIEEKYSKWYDIANYKDLVIFSREKSHTLLLEYIKLNLDLSFKDDIDYMLIREEVFNPFSDSNIKVFNRLDIEKINEDTKTSSNYLRKHFDTTDIGLAVGFKTASYFVF